MGAVLRAMLAAGLASAALLAFAPAPAFGAYSHATVEKIFEAGECNEGIRDLSVVESSELIYVVCAKGFFNGGNVIERYDYNGNPVDFSANKPYISGNTIFEDPGGEEGRIGRIAVDDSGGPNNGLIYVCGDVNIDIFNPAGEFIGIVKQKTEGGAGNFNIDVAVGPDGFVYVTSANPGGRISKYNLAWHEVRRLYPNSSWFLDPETKYMRTDTDGGVWVIRGGGFFGTTGTLWKFEADQFLTNLSISPADFSKEELMETVKATPSPYISGPESIYGGTPLIPEENVSGVEVDPTDNDVYVDRGNRIETYSQGTEAEASFQNAPTFGTGTLFGSTAIDVTKDHRVFATTGGKEIVRFGPGDLIPDITTKPAAVDDVGHTTATVKGRVKLSGGGDITECEVEYGPTTAYGTKAGCSPDPSATPPSSNFSADTDVSAAMSGLTPGDVYHYRFVAGNEKGQNAGVDRTLVAAYVIKTNTLAASGIEMDRATLNGSVDPDGAATTYHFEYGATTTYGQSTAEESAGSAAGVKPLAATVTDLPSGKKLHYRIVATNASGTTYGPDVTFRTASPPDIGGVTANELNATGATLNASINPTGYATSYLFEYGTTPEYGQSIPATPEEIGSGTELVAVSKQVTGLQEGFTYHFRVVATNVWGTSVSPDVSFDFAPPNCPNEHVRQQTKSAYLPDCRAYEIVSPGSAGSILLLPSNFLWDEGSQNEYLEGVNWPVNSATATAPSRFSFWGGLGQITGLDAPNTQADMYMATRTTQGWVTTLPGLTASETGGGSSKQCTETMDRCIDHATTILNGYDYAPYLFTAEGKKLGQLPTNVDALPKQKPYTFHGAQRLSGDGSHYVFSSTQYKEPFGPNSFPGVAFAPGGVTTGIGSAYDNDIANRSVTIVSKLQNGDDIPADGADTHAIEFPAVSPDGSHILMQTRATNGPAHLFMRVDHSITYDISRGAGVQFAGMTKDGSTVYFSTSANLTPDDTDASKDLYMWQEEGDTLTRISQGNGNGNSDNCHPDWTNDCDAVLVEPDRLLPADNSAVSSPGIDNVMAEQNGDIYFFSPELLDGSKPAVPDERNLYVYRNGAPHFVAAFDPGTTISRMQVSPNDSHAAWITGSQMTPYDNEGFEEMYTYDVSGDKIECASCKPNGQPPRNNVEGSSAGPFMANDGRAFFSTKDALVPRDRNGEIIDVYEYDEGRPQLITSGVGSRDFTGGGELFSLLGRPQNIGLESVSADGVDVFFSTYETLVDQDQNGAFVKFYDARSGGGFPSEPELLPCAAADECHGPDSSQPSPPVVATGAGLGSGGNFESSAPKATKKKHHKHKHRKKRRHGGNVRRAHG